MGMNSYSMWSVCRSHPYALIELPRVTVVVKVANHFAALEAVEDPIEAVVISPGRDYNVVRASSEADGGGILDVEAVSDFNNCVREVDLVEHPHSGSTYTWCRNWREKGVLNVLDRMLCNYKWLENFKGAMVDILVAAECDHCSLNITVIPNMEQEPKPFKY
ncbi:hypothetical protein LIER_04838 [Lithospermum erythrorhizon]|uniref:Uncharacterized protein n=1 Tax=Lithospermum erythrorhizon TaxID=34254 RepID=A0AAV3P040_LITER